MRVSLLILIVITMCANSAQARIYTCKDKDGNTVYSDIPEACPDAEEVQVDSLPQLIETKPLAVPNATTTQSKKQEAISSYESLVITTPGDEETLRSNEGNVTIAFQASPALNARNGHQYIILLGDKEVYKGTKNSVALKNVDRGTHVVTAKIVARNGRTLISSESVQFTLQRFSRLQGNFPGIPPGAGVPPGGGGTTSGGAGPSPSP